MNDAVCSTTPRRSTRKGAKCRSPGSPKDIANQLLSAISVPIQTLNGVVFAAAPDGETTFFGSSNALFGWIPSQGIHAVWSKKDGVLSKGEFLSYLANVLPRYTSINSAPHEPPLEGVFYTSKPEGHDLYRSP